MTTTQDVIASAMSVARDAAEGRLDPANLEAAAVEECRALVGTVTGPDNPLWGLQVEIARGVHAADGIPATELAEWASVARSGVGGSDGPPQPLSSASGATSGHSGGPDGDAEA